MATLTAAATLASTATLVASHAGDANAALDAVVTLTPDATVYENDLVGAQDFMQLNAFTLSGYMGGGNNITLPAFTADGTILNGSVLVGSSQFSKLGAFTASGVMLSGNIAQGDITLPLFTLSAYTATAGSITLPVFTVEGTAHAGQLLVGEVTLPALTADGTASGENIGAASGSMVLPAFEVSGTCSSSNEMAGSISLGAFTLEAYAEAGSIMTGSITLPVLSVDGAGYSDITGQAELILPLFNINGFMSGSVESADPAASYAMALATKALTKYGMGFNSGTVFNGTSLVANANGVYAITGDTDDGTNIDATIKFPVSGGLVERVREAVVSCRTDGTLMLQVVPDESDEIYEYVLATYSDKLRSQKAKLGRGLSATGFEAILSNVDGVGFDINYLDFRTDPTRRRR